MINFWTRRQPKGRAPATQGRPVPTLPDTTLLRGLLQTAADEELLTRFQRVGRELKADGSFVTEADLAMQQRVAALLKLHWPEYPLLGEEMTAEAQQALLDGEHPGLWCLDPLDGTSNFAAGIPFFAVSLALLVGGKVVIGLVYDPIRRECFWAERGRGAWLDRQPLRAAPAGVGLEQSIGIVDFKRLSPELAQWLAEKPPYRSQRSFGSVALDWCWIAAGRGHVYLHGRQRIWDYAAGSLILDEAGGRAVTLDGEPVFRPDMAPRSAVAALNAELFKEWTAYLQITTTG
ncbi:MAG TPA: inositol monophosphatase family protein [Gammaproteobacteria bacterium]|nr:inositol monophosphatase family protein [Gammaproteobacteria bacterium]